MPEYLERVERDTPLEDTKRKKKRWAKQFLDVMGWNSPLKVVHQLG
jgi:hypothetical protein